MDCGIEVQRSSSSTDEKPKLLVLRGLRIERSVREEKTSKNCVRSIYPASFKNSSGFREKFKSVIRLPMRLSTPADESPPTGAVAVENSYPII